jgi:hypothetical protein
MLSSLCYLLLMSALIKSRTQIETVADKRTFGECSVCVNRVCCLQAHHALAGQVQLLRESISFGSSVIVIFGAHFFTISLYVVAATCAAVI